MRLWLEERALRLAYWLLAKCHHDCHSTGYLDHIRDAQREIAEIVTVYYGASGRAVGNR